MGKKLSRCKNVHLVCDQVDGESTWSLMHNDGWKDPYFGFYSNWLIEKGLSFNTRESYCYHVAQFIDYLIEANTWGIEKGKKYLSAQFLIEVIRSYPKALASGSNTQYEMVAELASRLDLKRRKVDSQAVHIVAINWYLHLSDIFNIRMAELELTHANGLPIFAEDQLFPTLRTSRSIPDGEKIRMAEKSVISGVICGGARLKRHCALTPDIPGSSGEDTGFDYRSAFPLEHSIDFIRNGFNNNRDRSLYSFLMASGCRIHEALLMTWDDICTVTKEAFLINPHQKMFEDFNGYLTYDEIKNLPWKKRTTKYTLLIEPFASEFWHFLELYQKNEMILTGQHPFIWQILKGENRGHPFWKSCPKSRRNTFKHACAAVGAPEMSPHSLRHEYGTYCLNYFPRENGSFGLPLGTVQCLLGHASPKTTMRYAIPDMELLALEQQVAKSVLSGLDTLSRKEIELKILESRIAKVTSDIRSERELALLK